MIHRRYPYVESEDYQEFSSLHDSLKLTGMICTIRIISIRAIACVEWSWLSELAGSHCDDDVVVERSPENWACPFHPRLVHIGTWVPLECSWVCCFCRISESGLQKDALGLWPWWSNIVCWRYYSQNRVIVLQEESGTTHQTRANIHTHLLVLWVQQGHPLGILLRIFVFFIVRSLWRLGW